MKSYFSKIVVFPGKIQINIVSQNSSVQETFAVAKGYSLLNQ